MKKLYKIVLLTFFSIVLCAGQVTISRTYDIDSSALTNKDSYFLEGFLSFQACDTMACIPITEEIIHQVNKSNDLITFSQNLEDITCNNNPKLPDWGLLNIDGFNQTSETSVEYTINFNINPGYHIFTTDFKFNIRVARKLFNTYYPLLQD